MTVPFQYKIQQTCEMFTHSWIRHIMISHSYLFLKYFEFCLLLFYSHVIPLNVPPPPALPRENKGWNASIYLKQKQAYVEKLARIWCMKGIEIYIVCRLEFTSVIFPTVSCSKLFSRSFKFVVSCYVLVKITPVLISQIWSTVQTPKCKLQQK